MSQEEIEYVLGTEKAELFRLGVQHQVWSSEARKAYDIAEFSAGQTILDLGSGPGYCSTELAYIVGQEGKVIAVDLSQNYIDVLNKKAKHEGLNIDARCTSFDDMKLNDHSIDGIYDRWALAWISNPEEIIEKIVKAMAPGAVFVAHEYYNWMTFQTEPELPAINRATAQAFKSMMDNGGNMNVGRQLPQLFFDAGLEVVSIRPMVKLATPDSLAWQWPKTFFEVYLPKLVPAYLSAKEVEEALYDLQDLEDTDGSTIFCPSMVEVVAIKA